MVNLGVASEEQASASDLMVRDVTEGSVSRQTLVVREEGRHQRTFDVVQCDLKAANILTTKTGNVKLSDFGVSLNLRAMEREIKDVAGTPNWMAPEVIELKGASPKSDIWSLGCTDIELLTLMFRIVEDESLPIPGRFFSPLVAFLKDNYLSMRL
ncbi:kinase-like domain-containing protein [Lactarius pseudohatsudake]|nr:kinase-like domain-containing protein [Lactarius pseudohatsudake]